MRHSTTLILAAVVIVAAALIWVFRDQLTGEPKPIEKPADALQLIEDLQVDELAEAKLEEAGTDGRMTTKVAFAKQDGTWRLTAPVDAPTDEWEVKRLLRPAVEAKYRKSIEPGATGQPTLKDLDLDPPAYRLTVTAKAKDQEPPRTVTIDVGRKPALGDGLYVRLAEAAQARVLEKAELLERSREKVETYRGKDLVTLTRDDLVRIEIAGEKGTVRLDRSADDADRWIVSEPLAARADSDTASAIVRAALDARAKAFIDDAPKDLAQYGLEKPRLVVTLYKPGKPAEKPKDEKKDDEKAKDEKKEEPKPEPVKAATLKFGTWADLKKETVYVTTDDTAGIVAVSKDTFADLDKGLADLRDKHVVAIDRNRVSKLALRIPAKLAETDADVAYELVKEKGAWQVKVEGRPDSKADASRVDDLLKELEELKVIYFAEGEHAEVAKAYQAQGSVRIRMENEPAESGFEIGGAGADTPALVKNIREDWIGRINPKNFEKLRADWLAALDKQVLEFKADEAVRLAIRSAGREVVLVKTGDEWKLTAPVKEEARAAFASDRLDSLKSLQATKFLATTKDFKPWKLDPAELTVTVTLKPAKQVKKPDEEPAKKDGEKSAPTAGEKAAEETPETQEAKPVVKTLHLSHHEKAKIVGRVEGSDLVFEAPLTLFKDLAGEPLPREVTNVSWSGIKTLVVATGETKVKLLKVDDTWYRADADGRPNEDVPSSKVEGVVKAAANLEAVRWAAYDAKDLASFGLDKPAVTITISGDKDKATVLISAKDVTADVAALYDEKPLCYAMAEGGKRVAILAGDKVGSLLGAAKTLSAKPAEPKADPAKPAEKPK